MTSRSLVVPKTYYVYTYAYPDPDGRVFYVGKGTGRRFFDHEREAQSGCPCKKCRVIRQIWASGKPVQKRIVYETFVEQDALLYEQKLINFIYSTSALTNIHNNRLQLSPTCKVNGEVYCSIDEACKRFSVTLQTLMRWSKRGWIRKYVSDVKHIYFSLTDLEKVTGMLPEEEWQQVRPNFRRPTP